MFTNLMSRYKLLFMLMISVPFSIMNFAAYSKGHIPSGLQASASVLFIAIWFVFGLMSYDRRKEFMLLSSIFWMGGGLLLAVGYFVDSYALFIPVAFIISGPLYGMRYFWDVPSDITFGLNSALVCYICSVIGLFASNIVKLKA